MKLYFFYIQILAFPLSILAAPREGEHMPHEPHRQACNVAVLNACRNEHAALAQQCRQDISSADMEIARNRVSFATSAFNREAVESALSKLEREESVLSSEISFIESGDKAQTTPLLEGFPSAEQLFGLQPLDRLWFERLPGIRRKSLSNQLGTVRQSITNQKGRRDKIITEYDGLNSAYQSLLARRGHLEAEVIQHDGAYNTGCRESICPAGEP